MALNKNILASIRLGQFFRSKEKFPYLTSYSQTAVARTEQRFIGDSYNNYFYKTIASLAKLKKYINRILTICIKD